MGLDMYLSGKRFMSENFNAGDSEKQAAIKALFPELANMTSSYSDPSPVSEVKIDAGYWRKANQIHAWFVKYVQDGEDECKPHVVSRDQLQQLKDTCETVLADHSKAAELLPCKPGFFFGSIDYNDMYFSEIADTIKILDAALALPNSWAFEYQSSW